MSWRNALVVALVVVLVLVGVPMLMPGMSAADCDLAVAGSPCGVVLLLSTALLVAAFWSALQCQRDLMLGLLLSHRLDRPPRRA